MKINLEIDMTSQVEQLTKQTIVNLITNIQSSVQNLGSQAYPAYQPPNGYYPTLFPLGQPPYYQMPMPRQFADPTQDTSQPQVESQPQKEEQPNLKFQKPSQTFNPLSQPSNRSLFFNQFGQPPFFAHQEYLVENILKEYGEMLNKSGLTNLIKAVYEHELKKVLGGLKETNQPTPKDTFVSKDTVTSD